MKSFQIFAAAAALAAASALVPAAAIAADPAELDCLLEGLSSGQRSALGEAIFSGDDAPPDVMALGMRLTGCARSHGWSDDETRYAFEYTFGTLAVESARAFLGGRGVDADAVERLALADAELIAGIDARVDAGTLGGAFAQRNAQRLQPFLGGREDEETLNVVGQFVYGAALRENARRRFPES